VRFGPTPLNDAEGAILAHSMRIGTRHLRKGAPLRAEDIAEMARAGLTEVVVAVLDHDDLGENQAAAQLAAAAVSAGIEVSPPHAGRANLIAQSAGVLEIDVEKVNAINGIDPAITLATLPAFARVDQGQMLATLKIIPYAVGAVHVAKAEALMAGALKLHPVKIQTVSLVMSTVDGMKPSLLEKGRRAVEMRLARLGVSLLEYTVVPHKTEAMAGAIAAAKGALVLVLGGSATSDIADVAPEAVRQAGGVVLRFGIPVDPGNLLFIGTADRRPVLGLPGCARALALNGADWVLERLLCDVPVDEAALLRMGVGGLLKEIPTRPQPRRGQSARDTRKVAVILLAAGLSRRMAGRDKLLEPVGEIPMIRHAARAALASKAATVFVALPPRDNARRAALADMAVTVVSAPDFAEGMGASLRNAMAHIGPDYDAVIVALADMPEVTDAHFDALISAYDPTQQREICRALTEDGVAGHPVLFGRRFFENLAAASGDSGGRDIVRTSGDFVFGVKTKGHGAALDLDTPEAWARWHSAEGL